MAKPAAGTYEPNKRVMLKVKHERDCDCVVAGFRWHKRGERSAVGSLLLGLYDDAGMLQHVGVCASFTDTKRRELVEFLAPYRENALDEHPWKEWADARGGRRAARSAARASRAAGVRAKICPGSRCGPSWWSRSPTTTCKAAASATPRNSAAGAPTSARRLHLRPARGRPAARARGDFREGVSDSVCRCAAARWERTCNPGPPDSYHQPWPERA